MAAAINCSALGSVPPWPLPPLLPRRCSAQWQLYNAGREEERRCRFCHETMPDWRWVLAQTSDGSGVNRKPAAASTTPPLPRPVGTPSPARPEDGLGGAPAMAEANPAPAAVSAFMRISFNGKSHKARNLTGGVGLPTL